MKNHTVKSQLFLRFTHSQLHVGASITVLGQANLMLGDVDAEDSSEMRGEDGGALTNAASHVDHQMCLVSLVT